MTTEERLREAARAYLDAEAEPAYSWVIESQQARAEERPNREVERMDRIARARVVLEEALDLAASTAAAPDPDRDGAPFPAGVNRPDYQPFDADDLSSIVLALEAIPTWFPETLAKARAMSQPDGEVITDAHGDELEHGGPGDFPGQFPEDAS